MSEGHCCLPNMSVSEQEGQWMKPKPPLSPMDVDWRLLKSLDADR